MNLNDLSTQLLFTTVPIWTEAADGTTSAATAFIYNAPIENKDQSIPLLVTNHHVLAGATRAVVEFIERKGDQPDRQQRVKAELDKATLSRWNDVDLDIAAVPLGPLFNSLQTSNRPVFFRSVDPGLVPADDVMKDLAAMEDIVFIGYPLGLRDEQNANPLIRRGITSTPIWNDFQGKPAFLIDAGVFPGSSGSPVFILNQGSYPTKNGLVVGSRLLFVGVITRTMMRSGAAGHAYVGLGKVVKSNAVRRFLESVVNQLKPS